MIDGWTTVPTNFTGKWPCNYGANRAGEREFRWSRACSSHAIINLVSPPSPSPTSVVVCHQIGGSYRNLESVHKPLRSPRTLRCWILISARGKQEPLERTRAHQATVYRFLAETTSAPPIVRVLLHDHNFCFDFSCFLPQAPVEETRKRWERLLFFLFPVPFFFGFGVYATLAHG